MESYSLFIVDSSKIKDKNYFYKEIINPYEYFKMKSYIEKITEEHYEIQPQNFIITLSSLV